MNKQSEEGILGIGIVFYFFEVGFLLGLINPSICGSGNCIVSPPFWLIMGGIGSMGVFLIVYSLLKMVERDIKEETPQEKK